MMNLIDTLDADVQPVCRAHLAECARQGILLKVCQARRTYPEQAAIYAKGRTADGEPCRHNGVMRPVGTCPEHPKGRTVTGARPGESWHNFGRAYDVCEQDKTPFDLGEIGQQDDDPLWTKIGEIGEALGLEWGGRWKKPDLPHFQLVHRMTLAEARLAHDNGEVRA